MKRILLSAIVAFSISHASAEHDAVSIRNLLKLEVEDLSSFMCDLQNLKPPLKKRVAIRVKIYRLSLSDLYISSSATATGQGRFDGIIAYAKDYSDTEKWVRSCTEASKIIYGKDGILYPYVDDAIFFAKFEKKSRLGKTIKRLCESNKSKDWLVPCCLVLEKPTYIPMPYSHIRASNDLGPCAKSIFSCTVTDIVPGDLYDSVKAKQPNQKKE